MPVRSSVGKTVFKAAMVVVLCWGVHRTVAAAWADLSAHEWSPAELRPGWLLASGCLYLAGLLPSGCFWHRVLWVLGQRPRLGETLRAYYIGHLGKYVPGKALVIVLRAGLIRSARVDAAVAAVSIFYETLTMMAVGSFLGGALLAFWFRHQRGPLLVALAMMLASGLPILPPIFRRLVIRLAPRRVDRAALEKISHFGYGALAVGWIGIACGWVLNGLSLAAVLFAMGYPMTPQTTDKILLCIISAALSVVAGFLSLVPGGAVVREAVLIALLPSLFGRTAAVVSAVLFRLVSLVAEIVISTILYLLGLRRDAPDPAAPEA